MSKLNCPFCSVPEVNIRRIPDAFLSRWLLRCRYCGAYVTSFTKWGALQKWNKILKKEHKYKEKYD